MNKNLGCNRFTGVLLPAEGYVAPYATNAIERLSSSLELDRHEDTQAAEDISACNESKCAHC
jgi:hypothetical protein